MARLTGPYQGFTGDSARRTTTQEFPLGTIASGVEGTEFAYVQANGAIIAGSAVKLAASATAPYDVVYATNANEVFFGVAEEAFADDEFGWVCVRGKCTCRLTNSTAAGSPLGTTTADGVLGLIDATAFGLAGRAVSLSASAGDSATVPVYIYIV